MMPYTCLLVILPFLIYMIAAHVHQFSSWTLKQQKGVVIMASPGAATPISDSDADDSDGRAFEALGSGMSQSNSTSEEPQVTSPASSQCADQLPPIWPHRFKLVQRRMPNATAHSRVDNAITVTYYDWIAGGNLIQVTSLDNASKPILWDLELSKHVQGDQSSHQSYYFYPATKKCTPAKFPVGILRPNWLEGATSLGESVLKDGSTVCGWTKVDFIDYFSDKVTGAPVQWYFHTMKATFFTLDYTIDPPDMDGSSLFDPPSFCLT